MDSAFEPHMVQLFRTLVGPSDVVADIGANIGLTALLFSTLADKVLAFEPSSSTYGFLQDNLAQAQVKNVETVNIGFGQRAESLTITFAANNRAGGYVSQKIRPTHGHVTEDISIETLDEFFSATNPKLTFLKIDVEGFEQNVIKGGRKLLNETKPVVVLEMNHFCLDVLQRITLPDFLDYLRSVFPCLYAIDSDNSVVADLHDPDQAYFVMHEHVVRQRFPNLVAGFNAGIKKKLDLLVASHDENTRKKNFQTPCVRKPSGRIIAAHVPEEIAVGGFFNVEVSLTNFGDNDWIGYGTHPVRLSYHWRTDDGRYLVYDGERTKLLSQIISAKTTVTETVRVNAPANKGEFRLVLTVVQEGVCWFEESGNFENASVKVRVV